MKKNNQHGFSPTLILTVIASLIIVSLVTWKLWDTYKPTQQTKQSQQSNNNIDTTPKTAQTQTFNMVNGAVHIDSVPQGWVKANENQLKKQIGDTTYLAQFQINDSDYLQKSVYIQKSAEVNKKVKIKDSSDAYIINIDGSYIAASSCAPYANKACSFKVGDKYLFTILNTYRQGDQSLSSLDFNNTYTNEALSDYAQMIEGMSF